MKRFATEVQRFAPETFYWEQHAEELKTTLSSAAYREEPEIVLIDPVPLSMSALNKIVGHSSRAFILLTSANHERAAGALRENMRIPIWAHKATKPDLEVHADDFFEDGEKLPGGLTAIHLPGCTPGESAFYTPKNNGMVFMGDALVNLDPEHGLTFLPDKYSQNPKQSRESLRKLLKLEFEIMTFAHGQPIVRDARKRLTALLDGGSRSKFKAVPPS